MRTFLNSVIYLITAFVTGWYAFWIWSSTTALWDRIGAVVLGIICIYCIRTLFCILARK